MPRDEIDDLFDLPTLTCDRCGRESDAALCNDCLADITGGPCDRRWNGRPVDAEADDRQDREERR